VNWKPLDVYVLTVTVWIKGNVSVLSGSMQQYRVLTCYFNKKKNVLNILIVILEVNALIPLHENWSLGSEAERTCTQTQVLLPFFHRKSFGVK
jgi:hypothetical protein